MADNKLSEMIRTSIDSIRSIADSGTVVGDPIPTNNGTVIIPVSKVTVGFASGGLDYMPKNGDKKEVVNTPANKPMLKGGLSCFGGGGGTGVSVTPVCFLIVDGTGNVTMLNINSPASVPPVVGAIDSVSNFTDKLPDVISKLKSVIGSKKKDKAESKEESMPADKKE